ncbi:hypothetical protein D9M69_442650 [compost metagenome]
MHFQVTGLPAGAAGFSIRVTVPALAVVSTSISPVASLQVRVSTLAVLSAATMSVAPLQFPDPCMPLLLAIFSPTVALTPEARVSASETRARMV